MQNHFTIHKNLPPPDHSFPLNPDQFKQILNPITKTQPHLKHPITNLLSQKLLPTSYKTTTSIQPQITNFAYTP
ncbi:N-acetylneuraminate synthase family protein, partial [Bacillus subtilis]|uniref:N-acetylneuraminate synthase family protein n=1 Tax=Bacillus subtilis TaxID=1423 RepID=UPI00338EC828